MKALIFPCGHQHELAIAIIRGHLLPMGLERVPLGGRLVVKSTRLWDDDRMFPCRQVEGRK